MQKRIVSALMVLLLVISSVFTPLGLFSAGAATLLDGTYSAAAVVEGYLDDELPPYTVTMGLEIRDGVIHNITYSTDMTSDLWAENEYYVEDAFTHLKNAASGRDNLDGIDAFSGATYVSNAMISASARALRDALEDPSGTLITPQVRPADARTALFYSAEKGAVFNVINENADAQIYYTMDGSLPIPSENSGAMPAAGNVITVSAASLAEDTSVVLKVAAIRGSVDSTVVEVPIVFLTKDGGVGIKQYNAVEYCSFGYNVQLIVTTTNGVITEIRDNQTVPGAGNQGYWEDALQLFARGTPRSLIGKTLPEIAELRTAASGTAEQKADAVTGATVVSNTAKYAIIKGLREEPFYYSPNTLEAPSITSDDGYFVFDNTLTEAVLRVEAPEGAAAHYTLDGTEPNPASPSVQDGALTIPNGGGAVELRVASFSNDGQRSDVAAKTLLFVPCMGIYNDGTYSRAHTAAR